MHKIHIKDGMPSGNPLANALVVIMGAIIIGVSIVLGFFAFLALSAVILVAASVIGIRAWWFRRQMRGNSESIKVHVKSREPGGVIEGEFRVVKKDKTS